MDSTKSLAQDDSIDETLQSNGRLSHGNSCLPPYAQSQSTISNNQNDNNPDLPRSTRNAEPLVPSVEWVYPSDYDGPRHELGSVELEFRSVGAVNEPSVQQESTAEISTNTIRIDPSQTIFIPTINGEVVTPRRCYVKIFGFRICDDNFTTKIHPWILIITLIIAVIAGLTGGLLYSPTTTSQVQSDDLPFTNPPSTIPSVAPSFDARTKNITGKLFTLTGDAILLFEKESPQSKALTWILYEDRMKLSHESPNLVQRYVTMVLYYSLGGEKWTNNGGYGSEEDECDWLGIVCSQSPNNIISIELEKNNLEGTLPEEIGFLSHLRELIFSTNKISNTLPSSIGMLAKLQILKIAGNDMSGTIPEEFSGLKSLEAIGLAGNQLSGTLPSFFGNFRFLQHVTFVRNGFTGTIPSSFSKLRLLTTLLITENKHTGTIPSELGMCQNLELLDLNNNNFEGTIPLSLGDLSFLKRMNLSHNRITGSIPKGLGRLSNLLILSLRNNLLTGRIPPDLGSLSKADLIDISHNIINGTISSNFENLHNLETLKMHDNIITGEVSEKICELQLKTMTGDCLGIEPELLCLCCTQCY